MSELGAIRETHRSDPVDIATGIGVPAVVAIACWGFAVYARAALEGTVLVPILIGAYAAFTLVRNRHSLTHVVRVHEGGMSWTVDGVSGEGRWHELTAVHGTHVAMRGDRNKPRLRFQFGERVLPLYFTLARFDALESSLLRQSAQVLSQAWREALRQGRTVPIGGGFALSRDRLVMGNGGFAWREVGGFQMQPGVLSIRLANGQTQAIGLAELPHPTLVAELGTELAAIGRAGQAFR